VDEDRLREGLEMIDERDHGGTRRKTLGQKIQAPKLDAMSPGDLELFPVPFPILFLPSQVHERPDAMTLDAALELFR
jgi:hypothetical protein